MLHPNFVGPFRIVRIDPICSQSPPPMSSFKKCVGYLDRENILKTAKALVEDTKMLVAGAASNQEQLAAAAQAAVKTITRLADVVKLGAGALGSDQPEAQVCIEWWCCMIAWRQLHGPGTLLRIGLEVFSLKAPKIARL